MVQIIPAAPQKPSFGSQLGLSLGGGLGSGFQQAISSMMDNKKQNKLQDLLIKGGASPIEAALVARSPKGAQSNFLNKLLGKKTNVYQEPDYGFDQDLEFEDRHTEGEPQGDERVDLEESMLGKYFEPVYEEEETSGSVFKDIDKYVSTRNEGLTAKDASISDKDRYDKNLPLFEEFDKHKESLNRNEERYNIMSSLSSKLPKNIGRINVNEDGNLRFPFLANSETQRFVKTLNEFAKGAKDTFGSRVTNFDLEQYMRTFPTLLNSEDGVKQILKQMKIVNDINKVYNNSLSEVFDRAGGIRKIDYDVAKRYAEKISKPKIESLVKKFQEIGSFEALPAASEFKGKRIKDKKTGEILISDGNEWVPQ